MQKLILKNDNSAKVNLKISEDGISHQVKHVFFIKKMILGYKVLGGGWIKS